MSERGILFTRATNLCMPAVRDPEHTEHTDAFHNVLSLFEPMFRLEELERTVQGATQVNLAQSNAQPVWNSRNHIHTAAVLAKVMEQTKRGSHPETDEST